MQLSSQVFDFVFEYQLETFTLSDFRLQDKVAILELFLFPQNGFDAGLLPIGFELLMESLLGVGAFALAERDHAVRVGVSVVQNFLGHQLILLLLVPRHDAVLRNWLELVHQLLFDLKAFYHLLARAHVAFVAQIVPLVLLVEFIGWVYVFFVRNAELLFCLFVG